jgi:hypothetical protein
LTRDAFCLEEARRRADRILEIDSKSVVPFAILDEIRRFGFGRPWENGTILIDAAAGLLELAALATLTGARVYSKHIESIREKVTG